MEMREEGLKKKIVVASRGDAATSAVSLRIQI